MTINRKLLATGLGALAILGTTVAAMAAPAVATGNVNVRSGPGTGYGVIDTLVRGQRVDVQQCRGSWCYVVKPGPDGWVSSSYLSAGSGWDNDWDNGWNRPPPPPPQWTPRPPRPPHWNQPRPPHWNPRPVPLPTPVYPSNPGASFCYNGPNGYFCLGS